MTSVNSSMPSRAWMPSQAWLLSQAWPRFPARLIHAAAWLCFCAGALAQPARADILWGVNGHPFNAYPGVNFDQQLGYIKDLGLKSYRVNISELTSAPALGELIRKAEPLGITILPVLTPSVDIAATAPDMLRSKAYDLAFGLVSKFKDKVRVWELGNELENHAIIQPCEMQDDGKQYNCAWGPAGGVGPLDYYGPRWVKVSALLKGMSEGAMAADPTAIKAMGTAGWGHLGAFERMRRDGLQWDISVWHMYGGDPEWAFKGLAPFGKPIWVTEMNHPLGSQKSEQEQADGMRLSMERLAALSAAYKVEAVHIYELLDETYWAPDAEATMGLVRLEKTPDGGWQTGSPKRAYDVVRGIARGGESGGAAEIKRDCALDKIAADLSPAEQQLDYTFCMLLGRKAEKSDLRVWSGLRQQNGTTLPAMWQALVQSPEFALRHRTAFLTDARFVSLLYRLLLGRDPDGQGLSDYTAEIESGKMARWRLIDAVVASDEFKTRHPLLFQPG